MQSTEVLTVLDLVETVAMNMKNENLGVLRMHMHCKGAWELFTEGILNINQHAMDGGQIASKDL